MTRLPAGRAGPMRAETMCRQDSRCIRDFLPEPANRVPLAVREAERVLVAEQVRAPNAAESIGISISLRCPMAASCRPCKSHGESSWWEVTPTSPPGRRGGGIRPGGKAGPALPPEAEEVAQAGDHHAQGCIGHACWRRLLRIASAPRSVRRQIAAPFCRRRNASSCFPVA
jgi:hypothetical protein